MAKLAQTAQTAIAVTILVLNLERWLRCLWAFLLGLFAVATMFFEQLELFPSSLSRFSPVRVSHYPLMA